MQPKTRYRTIRPDGSLNITQPKGVSFKDLYHDLLKISWTAFGLAFVGFYGTINALFGFIYFLIPGSEFEGFRFTEGLRSFLECFFFSVQTFGTIGYGHVSPIGVLANSVVTIESCVGMFVIAVMTGLIFARFAKPNAKILFSNKAVIRDFDGVPCLMFRIANERQNYITDARVKVSLAFDDPSSGYRVFQTLKLEREDSPIFSLSWTIAHDIDESSPLKGFNSKTFCEKNAEIVVTFSGTDTTLSHQVYAKYSYITEEIFKDHDFVDVMKRKSDGTIEILTDQFHDIKVMQKLLS